jgi:hypothetical protein
VQTIHVKRIININYFAGQSLFIILRFSNDLLNISKKAISVFSDIRTPKTEKMTVSEPPCYTLINSSQDLEPPSEMQLREDLEKGNDKVCVLIFFPKDFSK